jgi:hypothetical protein
LQIMMKQSKWLSALVPILGVLVVTLVSACGGRLSSVALCLEAPYSDPSVSFEKSNLVGAWETHYGRNADTLILRADGRFKQTYRRPGPEQYVYETPWNPWWIERLPDGGVRVHLQGARYYAEGPMIAELDGEGYPCPRDAPECPERDQLGPYAFYDPIADETVHMVRELVLNVREDSSGRLLLLHMWLGRNEGFVIFGCESTMFQAVERR